MATENNERALAGKVKPITIRRTFDLPIDTIWKAWTEPGSFKKWWGPDGYTCTSCTIDLSIGGKGLANMKGPDGKEIWSTMTYTEIAPMRKIVYDDNFSDSKGNPVAASYYDMPGEWPAEGNKVTVTFEELNGKTNMLLEHEGIPEDMQEDCINGWQESLDKIEKNLK
jgi:uncharacterized protein YndB with AHSA1/START domain